MKFGVFHYLLADFKSKYELRAILLQFKFFAVRKRAFDSLAQKVIKKLEMTTFLMNFLFYI